MTDKSHRQDPTEQLSARGLTRKSVPFGSLKAMRMVALPGGSGWICASVTLLQTAISRTRVTKVIMSPAREHWRQLLWGARCASRLAGSVSITLQSRRLQDMS